MVWYGRRSAEMPVAGAEDSDDSLCMLSVNGTDVTMLPLPPSRVPLQPLLLICLGNCCYCFHHYYGYLLHLILTHSNTTSNTVDGRTGLRMRWKHLRIQLLSLQCARRTDSGDPSHRSCRSGSRSRGPLPLPAAASVTSPATKGS